MSLHVPYITTDAFNLDAKGATDKLFVYASALVQNTLLDHGTKPYVLAVANVYK